MQQIVGTSAVGARAAVAGGRLSRAPVGEIHQTHREIVVPAQGMGV